MVPCLEVAAHRNHFGTAPTVIKVTGTAPRDLGHLRCPELIGIGKVALILKQ